MDQHFSFDIAKYTKSDYILVGFNLFTPIEQHEFIHQKVRGRVLSHTEPENINGCEQISSFYVVLNWNQEFYKRASSEEAKKRFITVISTDNIVNYELFSVKMAIVKKAAGILVRV